VVEEEDMVAVEAEEDTKVVVDTVAEEEEVSFD
jgi:hypothetical protein